MGDVHEAVAGEAERAYARLVDVHAGGMAEAGEQVGQDPSLAAGHRRAALGPQAPHERDGLLLVTGVAGLRQPLVDDRVEAQPVRQRGDGGPAPQRPRRHDHVDTEGRQLRREPLGLRPTAGRQRPVGVLGSPVPAGDRQRMAHQQDGAGRDRSSHELGEQVDLPLVGEPPRGGLRVQPGQPVHLRARREAAAQRPHRPVAHLLGNLPAPARLAVPHRRQTASDPGPVTGLLPDLAQRRQHVGLPPVELALGEGPVVVLGTVHQEHLAALAEDDGSGGEDVGLARHGASLTPRSGR